MPSKNNGLAFAWLALACIQTCFASDPATAPEFVTIPAADSKELTAANGWPALESYRTWTRSLGGPTSNRYSVLNQINRENVKNLRRVWTYHSGDGPGNMQCNPIVVGDTLFAPTTGKHVVALNAATGEERWRFSPVLGNSLEEMPARRGLLYWPGENQAPARLLFAAGKWIYALDPATGKPLPSFGEDGRSALPTSGTAGGAVWRHIFIIPGYFGDVFGYDVITGRLLWRFRTIPEPGEFGAETWEKREKGANCWSGISLDESRGIAYVSTGSPKPNFNGSGHRGDNLFSNCVIALDAATGKRLWHFQEIRHDIWDLDIPAPPNLVTVRHDGRMVDAVAQVTKIGNTLLLDRVSGKPLFPFRLRRAPASTLPGEKTAPYQPSVELPEPFVKHVFTFTRDDITTRTPEAHRFVADAVASAKLGEWFAPLAPGTNTVYFGINGGGEWTGASFDPTTGRLYVTANELPWMLSMAQDDDPPPLEPATTGEKVYQQSCASCHGPTRMGMTLAPHLRGLRHRMTDEQFLALLQTGRRLMPPITGLTDTQKTALLDFLFARDRPAVAANSGIPPRYLPSGRRLLDHEGYPGINPPWGTLNCLDLNTGKIVWQVPLGQYAGLAKAGGPKTGTENYGGATVTAGGLVFCGGTRDATFRAFDAGSGEELWSAPLPNDGSTPPTTYEVNGRQFVVIAAPGVRMLGGPSGDAWVAFALDEK